MFSMITSLSFPNNKIKENLSLEGLNKAGEDLMKMQDSDVRIVYLPPMCCARGILRTGGGWASG